MSLIWTVVLIYLAFIFAVCLVVARMIRFGTYDPTTQPYMGVDRRSKPR